MRRYANRRPMRPWERDAAAERRLAGDPVDLRVIERDPLPITITVDNRETGVRTVIDLLAPERRLRARCDQYAIAVDGKLVHEIASKTAARDLVAALMPPVLGGKVWNR